MRNLFILALCLVGLSANAQLFVTQTGEISFFSTTPMEDIDAVNKQVGSIINSANNEVAVQMRVTNFVFPNKLMQEHFNENYLETDKYPSATFKGKIKEKVYPCNVRLIFDWTNIKLIFRRLFLPKSLRSSRLKETFNTTYAK